MRTLNSATDLDTPVAQGSVLFDTHTEVRDYVRGFVVGVATMVQSRLPVYVRWLVSADTLAAILGAVFDKLWPVGTPAPALGAPGRR